MYCQQCGAEVGDGRFCRKCGAPAGTEALSVQQARHAAAPRTDYEKGFKKLFMGLAFLIIAIFPIFTSGMFWWWMLFPAVPLLAAGIAEFARGRSSAARALPAATVATLSAQPPLAQVNHAAQGELPRARNTSELVPPPPSVTEGTTRLLDKEPVQRD
jgi:hypothetical protein